VIFSTLECNYLKIKEIIWTFEHGIRLLELSNARRKSALIACQPLHERDWARVRLNAPITCF
jgi:hypothetical protein